MTKKRGKAKRQRTEPPSEPSLRPAHFPLPPPPPPPRPKVQPLPAAQQQARTMPLQARDLNILLPWQPHAGGVHGYAIGEAPLPRPVDPKPSSLVTRGQQQKRHFPLAAGAGIAAIDRPHQQRLQLRGARGPPPTSRRGGAAGGLLPLPPLQCACGGAAAQACPHRKCCRCCPGAGCQRHAATAWPR